ncbi:MAG TPA: CpaF family protein, partial [Ktedonobacterales bacterium]|nr:CpaF family protein [Ktedonobacterales bacterium]
GQNGAGDDNLRGPLSGRIGGGSGGAGNGQYSAFSNQPPRAASGGNDGGGRFPAPQPNQAAVARENNLFELKRKVQAALIAEMDPKMDLSQTAQVRRTIEELFNRILDQQNIVLTRNDRQRLFEAIAAEILGFGPIEPLLNDDSVTEIMVNGPRAVFVEQNGRLFRTDIRFRDDDHVMRVIERIVSPLGRRVDEAQPYVDARLPDGSRVNVIIPPLSLVGPVLTVRKFARRPLTPDDLVRLGTISQPMVDFLRACVEVRLNVVVSGGTGSGKTTLLNVLSGFIPGDQRIVTIEDAAELQLRQEHVVPLEARPANIEGNGRITIRDLVANSLRMRPDRIVVGEVRGAEALDMLQAMNTGHDGSLTTLHSNSPRDTLRRLETMVLMAGMDLPLRAIREQIASATNLVVHQERMRDGTRKITHITEVVGMEGDVVTLQDLFVYEQTGYDDGRVVGRLRPTGIRPSFMELFEMANIHLPAQMFGYGEAGAWRG